MNGVKLNVSFVLKITQRERKARMHGDGKGLCDLNGHFAEKLESAASFLAVS